MNNHNKLTVVLISYKSEKKIKSFIKKIPSDIKVIIVENSNNTILKKNIEKNYKNINVFIKKNEGVSASINYAVKKIKTKYFLQISPDVQFNFKDIRLFFDLAKKLNNKFAAIGPRFLYVKEKSHKQTNMKIDYGSINSIHGSCMFINKKCFNKIGKFDDNFFLYFEETEYCFRAKNKGYLTYQTNKSKVMSLGRSVEIKNISEKENIYYILIWHFIWSKFYFYTKKYGKTLSILIFIPVLVRNCFRIILYSVLKDKKKIKKYKFRLSGLLKSIIGNKSSLRP